MGDAAQTPSSGLPSVQDIDLFPALREQLRAELFIATRRHQGMSIDGEQFVARPGQAAATTMYLLDASALDHLPDADLKIRVLSYWDLLSNILTYEAFAQLKIDLAPANSVSGANRLELAHGLAWRLYRRYVTVPAVERLKALILRELGIRAAWVIGIALLGLIAVGFLPGCNPLQSIYFGVAGCGAAGATVSAVWRLNNVDPRREPLLTWLSLEDGKSSLLISPLIGAVFGIIFILFVQTKIIDLDVLPKISDFIGTCGSWGTPIQQDSAALAKTLLWGFAAGWTERLVPDVLNKLSQQSQNVLPNGSGQWSVLAKTATHPQEPRLDAEKARIPASNEPP